MSRGDIPPALVLAVFARDDGCMAPRLGGSYNDCWGRNRLEHVQDGYGRMGRRAQSDLGHLLVLCSGHTEDGVRGGYCWATDKVNRQRMREYLLEVGRVEATS